MEQVLCNVCGSDNYELLYKSNVDTVVCRNCGLVYVNPRLETNYVESFDTTRKNYKSNIKQNAKIAKKVYKWVTCFKRVGSILEIGCWNGYLLEEFKKNNWHVRGVEPNPKCNAPDYVKIGWFPDVHLGEKFDVILFRHTLEHMPDPRDVLDECRWLLKPGGAVMIITPDIKTPRGKFYDMFHNERLYFYSDRTLFSLAHLAGFGVSKIDYKDKLYATLQVGPSKLMYDDLKEVKDVIKDYKWNYYLTGRGVKRFVLHTLGKIKNKVIK